MGARVALLQLIRNALQHAVDFTFFLLFFWCTRADQSTAIQVDSSTVVFAKMQRVSHHSACFLKVDYTQYRYTQ